MKNIFIVILCLFCFMGCGINERLDRKDSRKIVDKRETDNHYVLITEDGHYIFVNIGDFVVVKTGDNYISSAYRWKK